MSYDLKIVGGDLVINQGSLQTVEDSEKLIQDILKICLTTVGANQFNPTYGSFLSRTIIGNPMYNDVIVQVSKSQLNTCLSNLQQLQQKQINSLQRVSADEQLASVLGISIVRSPTDPRLYSVKIKCLTKGFKPITTSFTVSTI